MKARSAVVLIAFAFVIGGGAIHPFGAVTQNRAAPILAGARIDTRNLERIQRSCANCHSEHVEWPWYSYAAPASWLMENDVKQARGHLNLSRWASYTTQQRINLLTVMGPALRAGAMPPHRYTALHPEAALSDAERNALYKWTKSERHRLQAHGRDD